MLIKIEEKLNIKVSVESDVSGINKIQKALQDLEKQGSKVSKIDTSKLTEKLSSKNSNLSINSKVAGDLKNIAEKAKETTKSTGLLENVFKGFRNTSGNAGNNLTKLGSSFASAASGSTALGGSLAALGGPVGIAVLAFGTMVNIGIELTQMFYELGMASAQYHDQENAFYVMSGGSSARFKEEAQELSKLGMSYMSSAAQMSQFYRELRSQGIDKGTSENMSTELVKRAGDIASITGVSKDRALFMVKDAMEGIYRPFKQVGVMMSDNELKSTAYANGIAKIGEELNETQKAQARYIMVMQNTNFAKGDLAQTKDATVNRVDQMSEAWNKLKLIVGAGIEPFINSAAGAFTRLLNWGTKVAMALQGYYFRLYTFLRGVWGFLTSGFKISGFNKGVEEAAAKIKSIMDQNSKTTQERAADLEKETDLNNQIKKDAEDAAEKEKEKNKAIKDNLQAFDQIHKLQADSGDDGKSGDGGTGQSGSKLDDVNTNVPTDEGEDKDPKDTELGFVFGPFPTLPALPAIPKLVLEWVLAKLPALPAIPSPKVVIDWVLGKIPPFPVFEPIPINVPFVFGSYAPELSAIYLAMLGIINANSLLILGRQLVLNFTLLAELARFGLNHNLKLQEIFTNALILEGIFAGSFIAVFARMLNGVVSLVPAFSPLLALAFNRVYLNELVGVKIFEVLYLTSFARLLAKVVESIDLKNPLIIEAFEKIYVKVLLGQLTFAGLFVGAVGTFLVNAIAKVGEMAPKLVLAFELAYGKVMGSTVKFFVSLIKKFGEGVIKVFEMAVNIAFVENPFLVLFGAILLSLGKFISNFFDSIGGLIKGAVKSISGFAGTANGIFLSFFEGVSTNVINFANSFGSRIVSLFSRALSAVKSLANSIGMSISATIPSWEDLGNTFKALKTEFSEKVDITTTIETIGVAGLIATGAKVIETVASVGSKVAMTADAVAGGFIGAIIPGGLENKTPGYQTQPKVREYADGGIITREQFAKIGEGNRPEVIVPLANTSFINQFASMVASKQGSNGNIRLEIPVMLDGKQIYKSVVDYDRKAGRPIVQVV